MQRPSANEILPLHQIRQTLGETRENSTCIVRPIENKKSLFRKHGESR
jgi:hypothetical protein